MTDAERLAAIEARAAQEAAVERAQLAEMCLSIARDGLRKIADNDTQLDEHLMALRALESSDLQGALRFVQLMKEIKAQGATEWLAAKRGGWHNAGVL